MPKPYIDTNIFLRFLVRDDDSPGLNEKAKDIIAAIKNGTITVQTNLLIVAEVIYVLDSFYEMEKEDIEFMVGRLLAMDHLEIDDKKYLLAALRMSTEKNIDFTDAYTAVVMQADDISQIYTFDKKHFSRIDDINVLSFT